MPSKRKLKRQLQSRNDKLKHYLLTSVQNKLPIALTMPETLAVIFRYLSVADRGRAAQVCVAWRLACDQPSVWRDDTCTLNPGAPIPIDSLRQRQISKIAFHSTANFDPKTKCLKSNGTLELTDIIMQDTLRPPNLSGITRLGIDDCRTLTDASVDVISRHLHNLISLELDSAKRLTDKSLLYIALRLRKVEDLALMRWDRLTDVGIGYLAGVIDLDTAYPYLVQKKSKEIVADLVGKDMPLVRLNICGCANVKNETLKHLSSMSSLLMLDISFCSLVDIAGMAYLASCSNLRTLLMLGCNKVNSNGLLYLAWVDSLRELDVGGCQGIAKDGIRRLARCCHRLKRLDITFCSNIVGDVMNYVCSGFRQLRCFLVDDINCPRDGYLLAFQYLPNLRLLHIRQTSQGDAETWVSYVLPQDCVLPRDDRVKLFEVLELLRLTDCGTPSYEFDGE